MAGQSQYLTPHLIETICDAEAMHYLQRLNGFWVTLWDFVNSCAQKGNSNNRKGQ